LLAAVIRLLVGGRSDLPGPLCQFGLGRDGTVYYIASGRANHAGTAKSVGTVSAGDGNFLYIGIEAFNDGVGEPYPAAQYDAYVLLVAALCVYVTKSSVNTVAGHKETSVTGKIDPRFDMNDFRAAVDKKMNELKTGNAVVQMSRGTRIDHALRDLRRAKGTGERAKKIQAAIAALKLIKPAKVNKTHTPKDTP
jgi:N-acetyl-anhydromuramyl-L-alanine amidase AmpD